MASKRQRRVLVSNYRFDPQSLDAQLSGLHAAVTGMSERMDKRFDDCDVRLVSIEEQAKKTNGRVGVLELWRATSTAKIAGFTAACGMVGGVLAWGIGVLVSK